MTRVIALPSVLVMAFPILNMVLAVSRVLAIPFYAMVRLW